MKIRAAIFDVYNTLLQVGLPPADADARWAQLFQATWGIAPPLRRLDFAVATSQVIAKLHDAARQRGIAHPEVNWPVVVSAVLPLLGRLDEARQAEFVYQQMQLGRTVRLFPHADTVLRELHQAGVWLGIASNAQAYTRRELAEHLGRAGLGLDRFEPALCVWSFEHGFSKPDPHVFQILAARLEARGIRPGQVLVVGDRFDNDIEPARRFEFQTWLLSATHSALPHTGTWAQLREWLRAGG